MILRGFFSDDKPSPWSLAPVRGTILFATYVHRKKCFSIFPSPAGMSLTKHSLGGNNDVIFKLYPPLVSDIPAGDVNIVKLFLGCTLSSSCPSFLASSLPFFPFVLLSCSSYSSFLVLRSLRRHRKHGEQIFAKLHLLKGPLGVDFIDRRNRGVSHPIFLQENRKNNSPI
jgi:hypothetical protein